MLLLLATVSTSLNVSHVFGPTTTTVQTFPHSLHSNTNGNVVEFSTVVGGCGAFPYISVTEYNVASQLATSKVNWSFRLPCGAQEEIFAATFADQFNGGVYLLTITGSKFATYKVSSAGVASTGNYTDASFSTTNIGIVATNNYVFIYNNHHLLIVSNTTNHYDGTDTYWGATSDGTDIFLLASKTATTNFYFAKVVYSNSANTFTYTSSSTLTLTNSTGPLVSKLVPANSTFFYRQPLFYCASSLRATFASTDATKYEVFDYSTALTSSSHFAENGLNALTDIVVEVGCNEISGNTYSLVETLVNDNPTYSYTVYYYPGMVFNTTLAVTMGYTNLAIPTYIALAATPQGTLYIHREGLLNLGTGTEIYGQIYSNCGPNDYGENCLPCLCASGFCDQGETGTGACLSCNQTTYGPYCNNSCHCLVPATTACSNGPTGTGQCSCTDPYAAGFDCQDCNSGYFMDASDSCQECPLYNYCINCKPLLSSFSLVV